MNVKLPLLDVIVPGNGCQFGFCKEVVYSTLYWPVDGPVQLKVNAFADAEIFGVAAGANGVVIEASVNTSKN